MHSMRIECLEIKVCKEKLSKGSKHTHTCMRADLALYTVPESIADSSE